MLNQPTNKEKEMNKRTILRRSNWFKEDGCLPARIILHDIDKGDRIEYVTHLEVEDTDNDYYCIQGHYFIDYKDTEKDFIERCDKFHIAIDHDLRCCICGKRIVAENPGGWDQGNNAEPISTGRCCDDCNNTVVFPARMKNIR